MERFDNLLDQVQEELTKNFHPKYCGRCGNVLAATNGGFYCPYCHVSYQYMGSGFMEIGEVVPDFVAKLRSN